MLFHKQAGMDFDGSFSSIVKPTAICAILSHAISCGWFMHQLDVKNDFLYGDLVKTVYMAQPPGSLIPLALITFFIFRRLFID